MIIRHLIHCILVLKVVFSRTLRLCILSCGAVNFVEVVSGGDNLAHESMKYTWSGIIGVQVLTNLALILIHILDLRLYACSSGMLFGSGGYRFSFRSYKFYQVEGSMDRFFLRSDQFMTVHIKQETFTLPFTQVGEGERDAKISRH